MNKHPPPPPINVLATALTCSLGSGDYPCGPVGTSTTILPLEKCTRDMTSHLSNLGISLKRRRSGELKTTISEVQLIFNRARLLVQFEEEQIGMITICPKHRRDLTVGWPGRKRSSCSHPSHKGQRKQMKIFRRMNGSMSDEIFAMHKKSVPIGSDKCRSHGLSPFISIYFII